MLGLLLLVSAARSACAALVEFGMRSASDATAVLGLIVTAITFYAGLGLLLKDVRGILLPTTFRRKAAQAAMEGDLGNQTKHLHREAGVWKQL